jgi:hypothetical protein
VIFYGWRIVAAAFLVLFTAYGAQYSFGVFFAALLDEFGWSRAGLAGVFSFRSCTWSRLPATWATAPLPAPGW